MINTLLDFAVQKVFERKSLLANENLPDIYLEDNDKIWCKYLIKIVATTRPDFINCKANHAVKNRHSVADVP